MNKKELIKKMSELGYEEMSEEEFYELDDDDGEINIVEYINDESTDLYFKPTIKFPIVFTGDSFIFKVTPRFKDFTITSETKAESEHSKFYYSENDLEALENAVKKVNELRKTQ